MSNENGATSGSNEPNPEAATLGSFIATKTVLRALCTLHPERVRLLEALRQEHEETMSYLLARPFPEATIESYTNALVAIAPDVEQVLRSGSPD
jgi:hypothetical protein